MHAIISVNGVEAKLGHVELEAMCWSLEDRDKNAGVLNELAKSGCVEIRKTVASYEELYGDTIEMLIKDNSIEVLREIVSNNQATEYLEKDDLIRFFKLGDTELLSSIAADVERYSEQYEICELKWVCEQLSNHSDPSVRAMLAENEDVPMYILQKLSEDEDIDVASKAEATIEELESFEEYDDDDIVVIETD
jgi:hypothetical protein